MSYTWTDDKKISGKDIDWDWGGGYLHQIKRLRYRYSSESCGGRCTVELYEYRLLTTGEGDEGRSKLRRIEVCVRVGWKASTFEKD